MISFPVHLSSATALPWETTEQKNDKFSRKKHIFYEQITLNDILFYA